MQRIINVAVIVLFALMAVAFTLESIVNVGIDFGQKVREYPDSGFEFSLIKAPEESANKVQEFLWKCADDNDAMIIRRDDVLSKIDGSVDAYHLGFYGNVSKNSDALELKMGSADLLNEVNLSKLLTSGPDSTLGLDKIRPDMVGGIPSIKFSPRLVAVQLQKLIEDSGTIRGKYSVVGLSQQQFDSLVGELSSATGLTTDEILHPLAGSATSESFFNSIMLAVGIICFVLVGLVTLIWALLQVKPFGVHLILGWSKAGYLLKSYAIFLAGIACLAIVPVILCLHCFIDFPLQFVLLSVVPAQILKFFVIAVLALLPSVLAVLLVRPVAAIRGQISHRSLLVLVVGLFLFSSVGTVASLRMIDGPLREVRNLSEVQAKWQDYGDYQILYKDSVGDNPSSFAQQSDEHLKELYSWYSAIQDLPGVSLVHTAYYGSDLFDIWKGSFNTVPIKPFWYMTASPSYLQEVGFDVTTEDSASAKDGVRVYYLPDTYSEDERQALEGWLSEDALKDRGESIVTPFMQDQQIEFRYYTPKDNLFMWNSELSESFEAPDPVVLLTTAENMTPFESESLNAIGLSQSYLKLTGEAVASYANQDYLAQYSLDDNQLEFRPANDFIAGLQKNMTEFIQLFGGVALFIIILDLGLLAAVITLYGKINLETVAVKRLLGFPLMNIFWMPFILVISVGLISVVTSALLGSAIGVRIVFALFVAQLLLMFFQANAMATKQIVSVVKDR